MTLVDLLLRRAAIDGERRQSRANLLLETADPLHEEFIEIRIVNREEPNAFE